MYPFRLPSSPPVVECHLLVPTTVPPMVLSFSLTVCAFLHPAAALQLINGSGVPSLTDLEGDVEKLFRSLQDQAANLPEQEPPEPIIPPLFPHQKQALYWMSQKEQLRNAFSDEYKVRIIPIFPHCMMSFNVRSRFCLGTREALMVRRYISTAPLIRPSSNFLLTLEVAF